MLPVARIRCEKGRACERQEKGGEGGPGLLPETGPTGQGAPGGRGLGTPQPPSSERSKAITLSRPRGSTRTRAITQGVARVLPGRHTQNWEGRAPTAAARPGRGDRVQTSSTPASCVESVWNLLGISQETSPAPTKKGREGGKEGNSI